MSLVTDSGGCLSAFLQTNHWHLFSRAERQSFSEQYSTTDKNKKKTQNYNTIKKITQTINIGDRDFSERKTWQNKSIKISFLGGRF